MKHFLALKLYSQLQAKTQDTSEGLFRIFCQFLHEVERFRVFYHK